MKINSALLAGLIVLSVFHTKEINAQSNGSGLFSKGDNVTSAGVGLGYLFLCKFRLFSKPQPYLNIRKCYY